MDDQAMQIVVGVFLVALYSYRRYNTPNSNRYATTNARFHFFYLVYLCITLSAFCILLIIANQTANNKDVIPEWMLRSIGSALEGMPPPLAATLMLTTLLPNIPWLAKADRTILDHMWNFGKIPAYLVIQIEKLRRSHINPSPKQQEYIYQLAEEWGIDPAFEPDCSLVYKWTKTNLIIREIELTKYSPNLRYKRYLESRASDLERLQFDIKSISKKLSTYMQLRSQTDNHTDQPNKTERQLHESIEERLEQIHRWSLEFLVLMTNNAEKTEKKRSERYRTVGFEDGGKFNNDITVSQKFQLAIVLLGGYLIFSILDNLIPHSILNNLTPQEIAKPGNDMLSYKILFQSLIMATTYNMAILSAIYMHSIQKKRFVANNNFKFVTRFMAGLIAAITWLASVFILRYLDFYITEGEFKKITESIQRTYPYALQSFTIGFVLTWLLEKAHEPTPLAQDIDISKTRYSYTIMMAGALIVATVPIAFWLNELKESKYIQIFGVLSEVLKAGGIGIIIGYFVPYWYQINRIKKPMASLNSHINYYYKKLCKETRELDLGQFEAILINNAVYIANSDGHIHQLEVKTIKEIIFRLDAKLEDFSVDRANKLLENYRLDGTVETALSDGSIEACLRHLPHLRQIMIYALEAVAMADGAIEDSERLALQKFIHLVSSPGEDGPLPQDPVLTH